MYTGYAESHDGKVWTKPKLGLFDAMGTRDNNLVWAEDGSHCFAPFIDENPACKPEERYKAVSRSDKTNNLHGYVSADAIHWTELPEPRLTSQVGAFDSQNLVFWDTVRKEYRCYFRTFRGDVRTITTAVSPDFLHWNDIKDIQFDDKATIAHYTNVIKPYFRAPNILIGFPVRYCDRGWSESMRALPMLKEREGRAKLSERYGTAITDSVMITSRDGVNFHRWGEAFIRPGLRTADNWVYGDNYMAWQAVTTKADMENAPDELSFYSIESYWTGNDSKLRRYTMRMDGFVSINAPFKGGEFVTKPLVFDGTALALNFSTSAAGTIWIELQKADGTPIPGYTMDEAPPIFGDDLARTVPWKDGRNLSEFSGQPVRLRFRMSDADLYAMRFTR